ncbi:MAG: hypothetical protein H6744_12335 [Deltaproteobacteria bacterium]|nr:hypothetical protein [Deltaproteobacteria bacterium]
MRRPLTMLLCASAATLLAGPAFAGGASDVTAPKRWTVRDEPITVQSALYRGQHALTMRAELRVSPAAVAAAREGRPASPAEAPSHIAPPQVSYRSTGSTFGSPSLFDDAELEWINAATQAEAERAGTAVTVPAARVPVPVRAPAGVTARLQVEVVGLPVVSSPGAPVLLGATEPVNLQVVPDALPGAGDAVYSSVSSVTITPDVARACAATPAGQTCVIGYTLRIGRLSDATGSLVGLRVRASSEMGGAGLRAPRGVSMQLAVAR